MASIGIFLAFAIGLAVPWLPEPLGSKGIFVALIGFLMLIVAGLRASFRESSIGIFAFWFRPSETATIELNGNERLVVRIGLTLAFAPIISIAARLVISSMN